MPKTMPNGFLIIFDGIDGVGKTTQLQMAQEELSLAGWPVEVRRNLGGTPIGEELRKVMLSNIPRPTETNLYISAAIQEALIIGVAELRQSGKLILMDRGPLSLAAYEIFGSGLAGDLGWPIVDRGMSQLKPDLTILYKADVKQALARAKQKQETADYFESKPTDYFERVAEGYEEAAKRYQNVVTLDSNQSIEQVYKVTIDRLKQALQAHSSH